MQGSGGESGSHTLYTYVVYTYISLFLSSVIIPTFLRRLMITENRNMGMCLIKEEKYCCYVWDRCNDVIISIFVYVCPEFLYNFLVPHMRTCVCVCFFFLCVYGVACL